MEGTSMVTLNKTAKNMLDSTLKTLEYALELAAAKEDIESVIAISDRIMALFQYINELEMEGKKPKIGFHLADKERREEEDGRPD